MTASKIRPPRTPRGESAAVTIANQRRDIDTLTNRVMDLAKERDHALARANELDLELMNANTDHALIERDIERLTMQLADMRTAYTRMEGWRDCTLELFPTLAARLDR
jgi:chromosome segregation ATPase